MRYVLLQVLVARRGEEGQDEVRADTRLPLGSVGEPEDLGVRAVPVVQEHDRRQSPLHRILIVILSHNDNIEGFCFDLLKIYISIFSQNILAKFSRR